jgi:acyl-CoA thioester hydrolase
MAVSLHGRGARLAGTPYFEQLSQVRGGRSSRIQRHADASTPVRRMPNVPHTHRETVTAADLDAQQLLASHSVLRVFDTARTAYLADLLGTTDDASMGAIFAEAHLNFRSPVREGQEIEVRCTVADVRRSSLRVWFEMRTADHLAAEGYGVLVGYDYATGDAAPLREEIRAPLADAAESARS